MNLARAILGNTFAQVGGKLVTAILAIVVVKLLTGYLGEAGYGRYATIFEFLAFFGAIADFGIFTITVREMSKPNADQQKIFSTALGLRLITCSVAMIIAAIAGWFLYADWGMVRWGILLAAIFVWLDILNGTVTAGLQVKLKMPWAALSMVMGKIVSVGLIVTLILYIFPNSADAGFLPIVGMSITGALLTLLLSGFFVGRYYRLWPTWDKVAMKQLLREALPFAVALGLHTLYLKVDIILLSQLLPPSVEGVCQATFCGDTEVGYYAVAAKIISLGLLVAVFFLNSLLPALTNKLAAQEKNIENFLQQSLTFLFGLGVAAAALLFLLSKEITLIVAQPSFVGNTDGALEVLAGFLPLAFISSFFAYIFIATGQQKKLIWLAATAVTINVVGNILLIPLYGLTGAAAVSVGGETLLMLATVMLALKIQPFTLPWQKLLATLLVGLGAAIVTFFVQQNIEQFSAIITFLLVTIVFSLLYATGLHYTNVIHRDDIKQILKRSDSP